MEVISSKQKRSFFATYLAPVDSLSEIIFGLIMVLGFTSTARLVFGETSGARLLLAVIEGAYPWPQRGWLTTAA